MNVVARGASYDQEQFIAESKEMRLKHLEEQAMYALKISCENFDHAVFPNAMIGACRAPPSPPPRDDRPAAGRAGPADRTPPAAPPRQPATWSSPTCCTGWGTSRTGAPR